MIIMIALVTQVTRLTKRMRRVRETLDLKISKKKQANEDATQYETLEDRRRKGPNPYNSFTSNPERNRREIMTIRNNIDFWKDRDKEDKKKKERMQQEKEKQDRADRDGALNIITQNMRLKTQAVHPFSINDPFPNTQKY